MIRITYIITGLDLGGAETMLYKLLKTIDQRGIKPIVISLRTKGYYGAEIEKLGIQVEVINLSLNIRLFYRLLKLKKLIVDSNADIVHTWMYHADLVGGIIAKACGIKRIVWGIRNSELTLKRSRFTTLLVMRLCALLSNHVPNKIMSCSNNATNVHIKAGNDRSKFETIPNGFDIESFKPDKTAKFSVRNELGIPHDSPIIGLIARKDPEKNHFGFIQMAKMVSRVKPDVHYILAGTGIDPSNTELVNTIQKEYLSDNFHLLGRRNDIPRLMASLDILVSTSHSEAFPNVIGEAMASEVPCVVTNAGDSSYIVGPVGKVSEVGDMDNIAKSVIELLNMDKDEIARVGVASRQRVQDLFEIKLVTNQYIIFYKQLILKFK